MPHGIFGIYGEGDYLSKSFDGTFSMLRHSNESMSSIYGHRVDGTLRFNIYNISVPTTPKNIDLGSKEGELILNLACGYVHPSGYIGHDIQHNYKLGGDTAIINTGRIANAENLFNDISNRALIQLTLRDDPEVIPIIRGQLDEITSHGYILAYKLYQILKNDDHSSRHIVQTIQESLRYLGDSSFAPFIILNDRFIAGAVDPYGLRPLSIGYIDSFDGKAYALASYTSSLDAIGAEHIGDIDRGNVFFYDGKKEIEEPYNVRGSRMCIRELLFFADSDDRIYGIHVGKFREKCGEGLDRKLDYLYNETDVIAFVPQSAKSYYDGLLNAQAKRGFYKFSDRHHSVIRINPSYGRIALVDTDDRAERIKRKYHIDADHVKGQNVLIVENVVVSADTLRFLSSEMKRLGAKKVFAAIASDEPLGKCDKRESMGFLRPHGKKEILEKCPDLDELVFLGLDNVYKATEKSGYDFCADCFEKQTA